MRKKMIEAIKEHAKGHIQKHKMNVEVYLTNPVGVARTKLAIETAQKVGHVLECDHLERGSHRNAVEHAVQCRFRLVRIAICVETRVLGANWGDSQHVRGLWVWHSQPGAWSENLAMREALMEHGGRMLADHSAVELRRLY